MVIVLLALNENGERIEAEPGLRGLCPVCKQAVIPKCGDIKIWHWSHVASGACDSWSEGEGNWHLSWKKLVHPSQCEVVMGCHRADIVNGNGVIIELQHSPISAMDIHEREKFYGKMIWLFDVGDCFKNIKLRRKGSYYTFWWKWPRKHIAHARKPVFLDTGYFIFELKKMYDDTPCRGWGYAMETQEFINRYLTPKQDRRNRTYNTRS